MGVSRKDENSQAPGIILFFMRFSNFIWLFSELCYNMIRKSRYFPANPPKCLDFLFVYHTYYLIIKKHIAQYNVFLVRFKR